MPGPNKLIIGEGSYEKFNRASKMLRNIDFEPLSESEPDVAYNIMSGFLGAIAVISDTTIDDENNVINKRTPVNMDDYITGAKESLPNLDFYMAEPTDILIFKDPVPDDITDPYFSATKIVTIRPKILAY